MYVHVCQLITVISHSARRLEPDLLPLLQLVPLPLVHPWRPPACCCCRPGCQRPPAAHAGLLLELPLPPCCLQTAMQSTVTGYARWS